MNTTAVWAWGWSVVSTLVPSHHKDLLAVPRTAYTPTDPHAVAGSLGVPRGPDGVWPPGRVVVMNNPALWEGQMHGFRHQHLQMEVRIRTLQTRLARGRELGPFLR